MSLGPARHGEGARDTTEDSAFIISTARSSTVGSIVARSLSRRWEDPQNCGSYGAKALNLALLSTRRVEIQVLLDNSTYMQDVAITSAECIILGKGHDDK